MIFYPQVTMLKSFHFKMSFWFLLFFLKTNEKTNRPEVSYSQEETKSQLISKANWQVVNSSKKRTNEFIFITMRCVFIRFLEEIEDTKKTFRNYLTFRKMSIFNSSSFVKIWSACSCEFKALFWTFWAL